MIENILPNKRLYKIFLGIVKYIPNILALLKIISLILAYFEISSFALTCIGGTSIMYIIILYLISFIFKFCGLYRLSLNYITTITGLTIIDYYIGIPLSSLGMYQLYAAITGVFLISWIIYWYTHRNNPKIDYIKQLCDNICC